MSVVKTGLNVILVGVAVVISVLVITHQRGFEDKDIQKVQSVANTATVDATKAAAIKADTARLSELVTSFAQPYGTKVGVVVTDLADGASANVNGNEQFVSASIYKLFVGYDIYKKIDAGTLLYDQVVQTPDDENSTNTVSGCLNLMITISDNGCGEALAALEGWANLDAMLKSEGYTGTMLNNYMDNGEELNGDKQTDANDVALLLSRLYDGTLLSVASTNAYLTLLKAQTINDRLPQGLPAGTIIAHKTGDLYGYLHDAGIIYGGNRNTVVVLLTGDWDEPQGEGIPLFKTLAESVWSYMQS